MNSFQCGRPSGVRSNDQGGIAFLQWEQLSSLDMHSQLLHHCDSANNRCNVCP